MDADAKSLVVESAGLDGVMGDEPWTRLHVELVRSGLWASLKPCSRGVLITLASLSDRRKRVTIAGVQLVARLSGLSVARTMFAYRELRDRGLIWRRRAVLNGRQPARWTR